jgi:hypothetical protein
MSLVEIHGRLGTAALYFTLIMALWGLWRFFRRQGLDSNYWGAVVIAEILYLIQGGLGAFLFFSGMGNLTGRTIHILYGVVSVLVIPAIFVFTRGEETRRPMLAYGAGFLFLVGILLRGITTAG